MKITIERKHREPRMTERCIKKGHTATKRPYEVWETTFRDSDSRYISIKVEELTFLYKPVMRTQRFVQAEYIHIMCRAMREDDL